MNYLKKGKRCYKILIYNNKYFLNVTHMKRVSCLFIAIVILLTGIFPACIIASDPNTAQEVVSSGQYGKGYRYNIQGWVYVHIEGDPYERGYQYGYLASAEICDMIQRWTDRVYKDVKILKTFPFKSPEKAWSNFISKANRNFQKYIPEEYIEELKGLTDGLKDRGGKIFNREIEFDDVLTSQFVQDIQYMSFNNIIKRYHPIRSILSRVKGLISGGNINQEPGHCNAFIATGDATTDGQIVVAHATIFNPYIAERCNVILDVEPSDGYRFMLTGPPGSLWSQEDWYLNDQGILLTETELTPQGPWKKRATPKGVRSRTAIQYSKNIDEVIANLQKGNNGLIPNEWLIGDIKTGEICRFEQALFNTPVYRTFDGFYWSCNTPHDPKVFRELYGIFTLPLKIILKILPQLSNDVAEKFMEVEKEYYGKFDVELAKIIMAMHPFTKRVTDCKITDTKLIDNFGFLAHMGIPNGSIWNPTDEQKNKYSRVTELPASGWVEIYPINSDPTFRQSSDIINYKGTGNDPIWQYETDDTRNVIYTSSLIDEDVVYAVSSTGMLTALNSDNGRQIWSNKIGEKSVDLEISDELLFIGNNEGLIGVYKDSGKIKWEQLIGEISSKPVIVGDQIIASTIKGDLYGFDLNTGKIKWTDKFDDAVYISEEKEGDIYLGSGDICYSYDIKNNEKNWKFHMVWPITAAPKVNGDTVYVGSWGGSICALYSETGVKKWCYEIGWGIDSTPDVKDGTVFVGSLDNNLYALDEKNGDLKWFFTCKSAIHTNPVAYGEYVFFGCDDGRFYALDRTNGNLAWSFAPGFAIMDDDPNNYIITPILSNPLLENGVVYIGAKGIVYALDAQTFEKPIEPVDDEIDMVIISLLAIIIVISLILVYLQFKKKKGGKK